MFATKREFKQHVEECNGKHESCELNRRSTDSHLAAIRTMLEQFITEASPGVKSWNNKRTFADEMKNMSLWVAAVFGATSAIALMVSAVIKLYS